MFGTNFCAIALFFLPDCFPVAVVNFSSHIILNSEQLLQFSTVSFILESALFLLQLYYWAWIIFLVCGAMSISLFTFLVLLSVFEWSFGAAVSFPSSHDWPYFLWMLFWPLHTMTWIFFPTFGACSSGSVPTFGACSGGIVFPTLGHVVVDVFSHIIWRLKGEQFFNKWIITLTPRVSMEEISCQL